MRAGLTFKNQTTEWMIRDGEDSTMAFAASGWADFKSLAYPEPPKDCSDPVGMESPGGIALKSRCDATALNLHRCTFMAQQHFFSV